MFYKFNWKLSFFGSPYGRHCVVNLHWFVLQFLQVTTAGTTTRCQLRVILRFVCKLRKQALRRRKHWLLAQKISNCFYFTQAVCASTQQHPTLSKCLCKHPVCTNCMTTAADGTSMWRKLSGCSSYGVNFFYSFREHALIELFFFITYFFSTFRYFSLYLFSNLAFCSFILFLLLYSVLVTHHRGGSDLYFSIN